MSIFDPIASGAIGEIGSDLQDLLIFVPTPEEVTFTSEVPLVVGGCSVASPSSGITIGTLVPEVFTGTNIEPSQADILIQTVQCTVVQSATIHPPASEIVFEALPPITFSGALIEVPGATIAFDQSEPFVTTGKAQFVSAITINVQTLVPEVSISYNAYPNTIGITIDAPIPRILVGNYIEASNTISMQTPYNEIASTTIGSLAIGEGEPSTRIVKTSPRIIFSADPPFVTAGKSQLVPAGIINISAMRPEIDSRSRKLRVLAIAS